MDLRFAQHRRQRSDLFRLFWPPERETAALHQFLPAQA